MHLYELHFEVHGCSLVVVRWSKGEPHLSGYIHQVPKHVPKVLFWSCFIDEGPSSLLVSWEWWIAINTKWFYMFTFFQRYKMNFLMAIVFSNRISLHIILADKMCTFFRESQRSTLDWPGNSGINSIENFWSITKRRIEKDDCSMMQKLICVVTNAWYRDEEL